MKQAKRLISFILVVALCLQLGITADAKAQRATQDKDYAITYQYFNVYQESSYVRYDAIIEILNTSAGNLYLDNATFDIYNAAGSIVKSENWISNTPDVIGPGEKGYFYSQWGSMDNLPMAQYTMIPTLTVEYTTLPVVRYPVANVSIQDGTFDSFKIVGIIGNATTEDLSHMYLNIVCYNAADIPIFISGTNISDIFAGQVKGFEVSSIFAPDYIKKSDIARVEVIAEPSQYQW